jgi:hypothetical protein
MWSRPFQLSWINGSDRENYRTLGSALVSLLLEKKTRAASLFHNHELFSSFVVEQNDVVSVASDPTISEPARSKAMHLMTTQSAAIAEHLD